MPVRISCACAVMDRTGKEHHPGCPFWKPQTKGNEQMARRTKKDTAPVAEPASSQEVRAYLLEHEGELPADVRVSGRGRLSARAKEFFTEATGRPVVAMGA